MVDLGSVPDEGLLQEGSTKDAGIHRSIPQCGYYESYSSPSILYSVLGTGATFIATVIGDNNFRPQVTMFHGNCAELACNDHYREGNDNSNYRQDGAEEIVDSIEGQIYYLLVNSPQNSAESGEFVLSIDITMAGDMCTAESISEIPANGLLLSGSTDNMGFYSLPSCYHSVSSPAKVYSRTAGTESTISVSVDSFDFDARVSIYSGQCDGDKECAGIHNYRSARWTAEDDTTYYVAVFGCCGPRSTGEFLLRMESTESGDVCKHSIDLGFIPEDGLTELGLTETGQTYTDYSDCGVYVGSRTTMYSVLGTGGLITASLRPSLSDYRAEPQMVVLSGNCSALECMDYTAEYSRPAVSVSWSSVEGASYYIAISGCCEFETTLDYELELKSTESSDLCTGAIAIGMPPIGEWTETGSFNDGAGYFPTLSSCYGDAAKSAVVYSMVGYGNVVTASTDSGYRLAVVTGSCASPSCIGGYGWETEISWSLESDETYYVAIFGGDRSKDSFELTMQSILALDICTSEVVTDLGSIPDEGLVLPGSLDSEVIYGGLVSCQEYDDSNNTTLATPGAAYTMTGTGESYILSVQDASFGVLVNAYKGACDELACARSNTFGSFTLETQVNEIYTIVVTDCCGVGQPGTFDPNIMPVVAGNAMADAVDLGAAAEAGLFEGGSTDTGMFYTDLPSCYSENAAPAAVYKLQGRDGTMSASITGFGFDPQVSVYKEDGAGGLVCAGIHS